MITIKRLALTVTSIILALFSGSSKAEPDTYNKFGFSFQYPSGMAAEEEPYLDSEANEKSGVITLTTLEEPVVQLSVTWLSQPDKEKTSPEDHEELMNRLVGQRKVIYKTTVEKKSYGSHIVVEQRYVFIKGFGFVCSMGVWWCEESDRIFYISSTRPSRDIIAAFPGMTAADVKLPAENKDPTYRDYKILLRSFRCHAP